MHNDEQRTAPTISVVIPVYNNAERLREVLQAIQQQDYPPDGYEVIVVDNGSTDESRAVAQSFEQVQLLVETENLGSPYSARNRGIEAAEGEIIALLDSTCRPVVQWLSEGVQAIRRKEADLVAGEIEFEFEGDITLGKIFDSLTNVRVKEYVEKKQAATTGNLFVGRHVFEVQGEFPEGIRSGGDMRWTRAAVRAGYRLVYSAEAKTYYPARPLLPLLKKQWRIAKGHPTRWREERREISLVKVLILAVIPPRISSLRAKIRSSQCQEAEEHIASLWAINYLVRFITRLGHGYAIIKNTLGRITRPFSATTD
jgi:glycosyltransferase involved in cell wall biosynthesis